MNKTLAYNLIHLKNASIFKKGQVNLKFVKKFIPLLNFLYKEGLIQSYEIVNTNKSIKFKIIVYLRNYSFQSGINTLKILSTKASLFFLTYKDLLKISTREKTFVISTKEGLLSQLECKKKKVGGVVFFSC